MLRNRRVLILIIALLVALSMSIASAVMGGGASPVSNLLGTVLSPVQRLFGGVGDWVSSIYDYMYEFDALKAENEQLKIEIAEMREEVRESQQNNEENKRLRKLLELREKRRDFEFESAMIIARDVSNWSSTFTISKGSVHGIEVNSCVINEENYLVGFISEVGSTWSVVTTLIDTDMECGAIVFRTHAAAVCEGNFNLMQKGLLRLSYLPRGTDLLIGDQILTSGAGEKFPSGIVIGEVTGVFTEPTGIADYAEIKPAAELDSLKQVFVIKSFEISE